MSLNKPKSVDIPVAFLKEISSINFDIYLQVGDHDVLYCRPDDVRLSERLQKLQKNQSVDFFKVRAEQYEDFLNYIQKGLDQVFQLQKEVPSSQQVQSIFEQQSSLIHQVIDNLTSAENYHMLRSTCGPFYDFFAQDSKALGELYKLPAPKSKTEQMVTHMIRTAALASRLISETKNDLPGKPIYEMIMGTFLHDLHYFSEPWEFSAEAKTSAIYKDHPMTSEKIAHDTGHFEPWTLTVMSRHEEHMDGSGFPNNLREDVIDPCVFCIATANAFDRYITLKEMSAASALKQFLIEKMGAYPLTTLQAIQNILKDSKIV